MVLAKDDWRRGRIPLVLTLRRRRHSPCELPSRGGRPQLSPHLFSCYRQALRPLSPTVRHRSARRACAPASSTTEGSRRAFATRAVNRGAGAAPMAGTATAAAAGSGIRGSTAVFTARASGIRLTAMEAPAPRARAAAARSLSWSAPRRSTIWPRPRTRARTSAPQGGCVIHKLSYDRTGAYLGDRRTSEC